MAILRVSTRIFVDEFWGVIHNAIERDYEAKITYRGVDEVGDFILGIEGNGIPKGKKDIGVLVSDYLLDGEIIEGVCTINIV